MKLRDVVIPNIGVLCIGGENANAVVPLSQDSITVAANDATPTHAPHRRRLMRDAIFVAGVIFISNTYPTLCLSTFLYVSALL